MMLLTRVRGMALLGIFTTIIGVTTTIYALAILWLSPYRWVARTHFSNLSMSISVISTGVSCCVTAVFRASMRKQGLLSKHNRHFGCVLIYGAVFGIALLVCSAGRYSVSQKEQPSMQEIPEDALDPALVQKDSPLSQKEMFTTLPQSLSLNHSFQQLDAKVCDLEQALSLYHRLQQLRAEVRNMEQAHKLSAVIDVLHGVNGVVILFCAILTAATWSPKADAERDLEREAIAISQDSS